MAYGYSYYGETLDPREISAICRRSIRIKYFPEVADLLNGEFVELRDTTNYEADAYMAFSCAVFASISEYMQDKNDDSGFNQAEPNFGTANIPIQSESQQLISEFLIENEISAVRINRMADTINNALTTTVGFYDDDEFAPLLACLGASAASIGTAMLVDSERRQRLDADTLTSIRDNVSRLRNQLNGFPSTISKDFRDVARYYSRDVVAFYSTLEFYLSRESYGSQDARNLAKTLRNGTENTFGKYGNFLSRQDVETMTSEETRKAFATSTHATVKSQRTTTTGLDNEQIDGYLALSASQVNVTAKAIRDAVGRRPDVAIDVGQLLDSSSQIIDEFGNGEVQASTIEVFASDLTAVTSDVTGIFGRAYPLALFLSAGLAGASTALAADANRRQLTDADTTFNVGAQMGRIENYFSEMSDTAEEQVGSIVNFFTFDPGDLYDRVRNTAQDEYDDLLDFVQSEYDSDDPNESDSNDDTDSNNSSGPVPPAPPPRSVPSYAPTYPTPTGPRVPAGCVTYITGGTQRRVCYYN